MKAMIFAAGRGERMRPLTDTTPKPLLEVGGKPLIAWHMERLARAGIDDVVINISWLAEQFPATLGDGSRWDLAIHYSREPEGAYETGGGLLHALPLLGPDPFVLVSGDIWTDFDLRQLPTEPAGPAHLVLVDNPPHHPEGDFALGPDGRVQSSGDGSAPRLTYSGIALCRLELLDNWRTISGLPADAELQPPGFRLAPLLHAAAARDELTGQKHTGQWSDVGTPERLQTLRDELA